MNTLSFGAIISVCSLFSSVCTNDCLYAAVAPAVLDFTSTLALILVAPPHPASPTLCSLPPLTSRRLELSPRASLSIVPLFSLVLTGQVDWLEASSKYALLYAVETGH